uniref:(northern house mosquito) hypothetical protein n=1 Tax=Culex pipiens TaxID=7175 RepID=A0A8D8P3K5_CULPI
MFRTLRTGCTPFFSIWLLENRRLQSCSPANGTPSCKKSTNSYLRANCSGRSTVDSVVLSSSVTKSLLDTKLSERVQGRELDMLSIPWSHDRGTDPRQNRAITLVLFWPKRTIGRWWPSLSTVKQSISLQTGTSLSGPSQMRSIPLQSSLVWNCSC